MKEVVYSCKLCKAEFRIPYENFVVSVLALNQGLPPPDITGFSAIQGICIYCDVEDVVEFVGIYKGKVKIYDENLRS